ncbi:MAG: hypothetical protein H6740_26530, partial [Alphaproteobacteria bacterium]|nr:hypothetical protein [Alphaproteobacteria bacterium]
MLAPLLLLTACDPLGPGPGADDVPLAQGVGALRIDRTELDFGTLDVLTEGEAEQGFTATNVGDGALVVAG